MLAVVRRAAEILKSLEQDELQRGGRPSLSGASNDRQRHLAPLQPPPNEPHPVVARLRDLDVNTLTPMDALNLLASLKREADA